MKPLFNRYFLAFPNRLNANDILETTLSTLFLLMAMPMVVISFQIVLRVNLHVSFLRKNKKNKMKAKKIDIFSYVMRKLRQIVCFDLINWMKQTFNIFIQVYFIQLIKSNRFSNVISNQLFSLN